MNPILIPEDLQITPRLLAAAEASRGSRLPPGTRIFACPPPSEDAPIADHLDMLALKMRSVAAKMEREPHPEIRQHGTELSNAADTARTWAKGIRAGKVA